MRQEVQVQITTHRQKIGYHWNIDEPVYVSCRDMAQQLTRRIIVKDPLKIFDKRFKWDNWAYNRCVIHHSGVILLEIAFMREHQDQTPQDPEPAFAGDVSRILNIIDQHTRADRRVVNRTVKAARARRRISRSYVKRRASLHRYIRARSQASSIARAPAVARRQSRESPQLMPFGERPWQREVSPKEGSGQPRAVSRLA